jgi:hypothetical protein
LSARPTWRRSRKVLKASYQLAASLRAKRPCVAQTRWPSRTSAGVGVPRNAVRIERRACRCAPAGGESRGVVSKRIAAPARSIARAGVAGGLCRADRRSARDGVALRGCRWGAVSRSGDRRSDQAGSFALRDRSATGSDRTPHTARRQEARPQPGPGLHRSEANSEHLGW